ncbi:MAG: hypothetical protein CMB80_05595 [Flammeovirgaceae bacterium]|nr:hypothetical protein [Flammeovirgaceae bacterium]
MTRLKKFVLSLWLVNLIWPRPSHETVAYNNRNYHIVTVQAKSIPKQISVNQHNIPVQIISSPDEISYPTDLADGIQCYAGAGIGGLLIIAMATVSMADYCKAIIIASA